MIFVSYAQNFEDVRLWRAFGDVGAGRYLDIGTQDPVDDSVSLAFYERGWRGVHVEPTPAYASAVGAARPDEIVIQAAVSHSPGPLKFYEIPETGLSTGSEEIADRHKAAGWATREIVVPTVTLASIFDLMGPDQIHWLKIDVEGMEADVLSSWGDHPARPAALVIEATAPNTQDLTHEAWQEMVLSRGYAEVLFDGLSRYYVHETNAHRGPALAMSPNFFDGFQVSQKHFTVGMLCRERDSAIEAVRHEVEADRDAKISEIAAQIAEADAASAAAKVEADSRVEAMQDHMRALTRENGRLEGQLAAHIEGYTARLGNAEAIRQDLNRQLKRAQAALSAAQLDANATQTTLARLEERLAAEVACANDEVVRVRDAMSAQAEDHAVVANSLRDEIANLRDHIHWRERQLKAAAALLDATPQPLDGLPQLLSSIVRRFRSTQATAAIDQHEHRVRSWQNQLMLHSSSETQHAEPIADKSAAYAGWPTTTIGGNDIMEHEGPITSVPRLLAPCDRDFIVAAYQAVLGRAPDAAGELYYLGRLRSGAHKLEILKQLRRSPEGRAFIPGVAGLDRAIKRYQRANLPLIGAVVRLLTGAEGNNATHRQLRILVNEIARGRFEQAGLALRLDHLASSMQELAARPVGVTEVAPASPTPASPPAASLQPPNLDPGWMPESFDSTERRLLRTLQLFAISRGAPA